MTVVIMSLLIVTVVIIVKYEEVEAIEAQLKIFSVNIVIVL